MILESLRTPNPNCPACMVGRIHNQEDWLNHPDRGKGIDLLNGKTIKKEAKDGN